MIDKVNPGEKLKLFDELWSPRIVGQLNDHQVKLVKLQGEFVWHHHDDEDEMFLVVEGRMGIEFAEGATWLEPGEFIIVPRGVEHKPLAPEPCSVMLIEPGGVVNTGNIDNEQTREAVWL